MILDYAKLYSKKEGWFSAQLGTKLFNFLKERNYRVRSILDVACGTGEFVSIMKNGCPEVVGIDFEKAMIGVAKKNVHDATFEVAPLFDFDMKRKFDLVSANYETVNFATDQEKLNKFFTNVANHLEKNGIFVFDFKTPEGVAEDMLVFEESSDFDWMKKLSANGEFYDKHEVFYVATKENYRKIVNDEKRKVWSVAEIETALEKAGFYAINFCDQDLVVLKKPKKQKHVHVLCYKK